MSPIPDKLGRMSHIFPARPKCHALGSTLVVGTRFLGCSARCAADTPEYPHAELWNQPRGLDATNAVSAMSCNTPEKTAFTSA